MATSPLINIVGTFAKAGILPDPKQEQEDALAAKMGMFQQGLGGALAGSLTRFEREVRGSLTSTGLVDVRTQDNKFRQAINDIDPSAQDAQDQYVAVTKEFAPGKLPALMQGIKEAQDKEERLQFERDANERAAQGQANANQGARRTQELHGAAVIQAGLANDLTGLQIDKFRDDKEKQTKAVQFIQGSAYAKTRRPEYQAAVEAMRPEALMAALKVAADYDKKAQDNLILGITKMVGDDDELLGVIGDMSVAQLQIIFDAERSAGDPDWKIFKGHEGSYVFDMNEANNTPRIQFDARIPTAGDPNANDSEPPSELEVEGLMAKMADDQGLEELIEQYLGIDRLNSNDWATFYQGEREWLHQQRAPNGIQAVEARIKFLVTGPVAEDVATERQSLEADDIMNDLDQAGGIFNGPPVVAPGARVTPPRTPQPVASPPAMSVEDMLQSVDQIKNRNRLPIDTSGPARRAPSGIPGRSSILKSAGF